MTRPIDSAIEQKTIDLAKTDPHAARRYLGETLKLKKSQRNDLFNRIVNGGKPLPLPAKTDAPAPQSAKATFTSDTGVVESINRNISTVAELLKVCQVDLEVWEIEKHTVNKWEVVMREPATTVGGAGKDAVVSTSANGSKSTLWTRASNAPMHEPLYQVKVWLKKRRVAIELKSLVEHFITEAANHAPRVFKVGAPSKVRDCIYVLNIQDLHLGKLADSEETGDANWDIRIAERVYNAAIEDLIAKAPHQRIEEVVVIVGSDMLQVDNDMSQTTAGTYVDSDSRLSKAYGIAANMLVTNIERLASLFKVRVVVFPGNHDHTVSLFLGHYVSAWFRTNRNVVVDKEPKSRKYVAYGKTLIGFDHGNNTKHASLPLTMMRENQAIVSQFRHMEMLVGHYHRDSSSEQQGVKVRIAPALCPPDKWHAEKGFIGNIRTSQGLLYNKEHGLEAIYYSTPLVD